MSVNFWICFCSQNRQYVMRIIQNNAIFLGLSAVESRIYEIIGVENLEKNVWKEIKKSNWLKISLGLCMFYLILYGDSK